MIKRGNRDAQGFGRSCDGRIWPMGGIAPSDDSETYNDNAVRKIYNKARASYMVYLVLRWRHDTTQHSSCYRGPEK